jgi:hypothetical protein
MIGSRTPRIIGYHLLPNALGPIIVSVTLGIPRAIFAEAALSFLGVGINPPTPSWGQMIGRDGIANISYFWHLALFPALMIAFTMLGFTLMGDGLRDAFDPKTVEGNETFVSPDPSTRAVRIADRFYTLQSEFSLTSKGLSMNRDTRIPRWLMLIVGLVLALVLVGVWRTRRTRAQPAQRRSRRPLRAGGQSSGRRAAGGCCAA